MSAVLVLLRHAATDWNEQKRIQGRTDRPLSEAGQRQASRWRLPASLGLPANTPCFCSPLARCRDTARAMGLQPDIESNLIENSWGTWEGLRLADLRTTDPQGVAERERAGLDFHPPGGESARQAQARLRPFLLERLAAGGPSIAITHNGIIRAIYACAVAWDMTGPPPDRLKNGCAHQFRLTKDALPEPVALNLPLESPGEPPLESPGEPPVEPEGAGP